MSRTVRLLPAAEYDLDRLVGYLAERNPHAAKRAAATLTSAIRSLDEFAERGRVGPSKELRELVVRFGRDGFVVQYRVERTRVIVARVLHGRQDR